MARPMIQRGLRGEHRRDFTSLQHYTRRELATQLDMYRGRIKKRYDWRLNAS